MFVCCSLLKFYFCRLLYFVFVLFIFAVLSNDDMIRKIEKKKQRLYLGITGVSGSGKTYGALTIATGMTQPEKICVIDTERSVDMYADQFPGVGVIDLRPPFSPDRYIDAINAAQKSGTEVLVIDSGTHLWSGTGGACATAGSFKDWGPIHVGINKFTDAIRNSEMHVILTLRAKHAHVTETDDRGKNHVIKLGLGPEFKPNYEYEFGVALTIESNHVAFISKDRTGRLANYAGFTITRDFGRVLAGLNEDAPADELSMIRQMAYELRVPEAAKDKAIAGMPFASVDVGTLKLYSEHITKSNKPKTDHEVRVLDLMSRIEGLGRASDLGLKIGEALMSINGHAHKS